MVPGIERRENVPSINVKTRKLNSTRYFFCVLFAVFFFVLTIVPVQAVVIGANKAVINLENVMKSGYAEDMVTFTTDTDFNLSVTYTLKGDVAEWVRLEPTKNPFYISRDNPYTLSIIVEPPEDAKIDQYEGYIEFLTGALAGPDGQFGTSVRTAITIDLGVKVTGQEIVSCAIAEVNLDDVEEGYPIEIYGVTVNKGNVRIKPKISLEFWNQDQTKLVTILNFTVDDQVLPTTQRRFFNSLPHNLPIGQYWVKIKTPLCGDGGSSFLTISVIERGGVSDKGELVRIENPIDAKVGQIVPIDAVFSNLGSRVVSAKFKGTITSGSADNIFKVIDTEPIDIDPGQTEKLRTYFNPVQEGQYMVTGHVVYNRKITFDKSSIINVYPSGIIGDTKSLLGKAVIPLLLIAIILVILLLIRKKKNNQGGG